VSGGGHEGVRRGGSQKHTHIPWLYITYSHGGGRHYISWLHIMYSHGEVTCLSAVYFIL
jgi:hypothetical protein